MFSDSGLVNLETLCANLIGRFLANFTPDLYKIIQYFEALYTDYAAL